MSHNDDSIMDNAHDGFLSGESSDASSYDQKDAQEKISSDSVSENVATSTASGSTEAEKPAEKMSWSERHPVAAGIGNGLFYSVCFIIIAFFVWAFVIMKSAVITSGSMEPEIMPGDVVITAQCGADNKPTVGDVVMFYPKPDDPSKITHRVLSIVTMTDGTVKYQTKGDNNDTPDVDLIKQEQIIGCAKYKVPKIGWPISWVQNGLYSVRDVIRGASS